MKKLIFGAMLVIWGFVASNSALACSPNLPNYGNCVRMQQEQQQLYNYQYQMQQQQNSGYGSYDSGQGNRFGYRDDYLALMWVDDGKYYWFNNSVNSTDGIDHPTTREWARQQAVNACSAKKKGCQFAVDTYNNSCIAIAGIDKSLFAGTGQTCAIAKSNAMAYCQQNNDTSKACKVVKTKRP